MPRHFTRSISEKGPGRSANEAIDLSENEEGIEKTENVVRARKDSNSPEVEKFVESLLRIERREKGIERRKSKDKAAKEAVKEEKKERREKKGSSRRSSDAGKAKPPKKSLSKNKKEKPEKTSKKEPEASDSEEVTFLDEKESSPRQLRKRRASEEHVGETPKKKERRASKGSKSPEKREAASEDSRESNGDGAPTAVSAEKPKKEKVKKGKAKKAEETDSDTHRNGKTTEPPRSSPEVVIEGVSEGDEDVEASVDEEVVIEDTPEEAEVEVEASPVKEEAKLTNEELEHFKEEAEFAEDPELDEQIESSDSDAWEETSDIKEELGAPTKRRRRSRRGDANAVTDQTTPEEILESEVEDDIEPAVIEIASESEDEEEVTRRPIPRTTSSGPSSQVHLFSNFSHEISSQTPDPDINADTVTLYELVGVQDLVESVQFNFNVDLDYFLTFFHPDFSKKRRQLTIISGSPFLSTHRNRKEIEQKFNIREVIANLPNKFASHHTKMMVNFFTGGAVEIVISTANLTQLDFDGLTQACWRSGKLYPGKTTGLKGKRFRLDLMRYLARYKLEVTNDVLKKLDHLDFSNVTVELVASAPGTYNISDIEKGDVYGFGKLRQVLERNNLLIDDNEEKHNVLAQVTSIAYPFKSEKGQTSSVFSHLLCPLFFRDWQYVLAPGAYAFEDHQETFQYKPHIVFPTVDDIRHSNFGYLSGSAIHFKYTDTAVHKAQYEQNIKPYLRKWNYGETNTGRELLPPHVKYYAVDNGDDWKTLKWAMIGSHNLSKQAWGSPKQRSDTYEVGSYELSVLIPSGEKPLVPSYKRDTVKDPKKEPVRFPFVLPPKPYGPSDKPWSPSVDFGNKKDRWGNTFHGNFSI